MLEDEKQLISKVESLTKENNLNSEKHTESIERVKSLEASKMVAEEASKNAKELQKEKHMVAIDDYLAGGENAKVAKGSGESGQ